MTAMTFEQWRATGRDVEALPDASVVDDDRLYVGSPARVYEAGFIVFMGDLFAVPLPLEERQFATLAEAEQCLWTEWCRDEIGGVGFEGEGGGMSPPRTRQEANEIDEEADDDTLFP